jgi:hypothetical protein
VSGAFFAVAIGALLGAGDAGWALALMNSRTRAISSGVNDMNNNKSRLVSLRKSEINQQSHKANIHNLNVIDHFGFFF